MEKTIKIESKLSNLSVVENAIDTITRDSGINRENYGKIMVSVMEAVNNAIVHGNKYNEKKFVNVYFSLENNLLQVTIEDQGKGFRPSDVPDHTEPENLENVNGRGVFLMKNLADELEFNKAGNKVIMKFKNIIS
jgi:serine/threonine-protein kinase RsbW